MKKGYTKSVIVGFDTETCEGPPFAYQLYTEDQPNMNGVFAVDPSNVTSKFLRRLQRVCRPGIKYVLYCHNLRFDTPSIFWQCHERIVEGRDKGFEFTFEGWRIFGVHGGPNFIFMTHGHGDKEKSVVIVDSMSWFQSSLKKAAELVCPQLAKLEHPKGLGKIIFDVNDNDFADYAIRDVEIAFHLGKAIDAFHERFDIKQSVSVANMAANIFQRHYITDEILLPNDHHLRLAYAAYHGGKNHLVAGAAGIWHENIACIDIKSAFPHAMTQAPSFTKAKCYSGLKVFNSRTVKSVPEWGAYLCSGNASASKWPVIFDHKFKPIVGPFKDIAIHGFEVNEALRTGEVKFSSIAGYYYDADKDGTTETALQKFVNYFFKMKDETKSPVERLLFKTLMNSLYGKFIERREISVTDVNDREVIQLHAGRLYHSPLGCGITAHTRATMHRLENDFKGIHTATDGLIVPARADQKYSPSYMPKSGLGSLSLEAEGNAVIVRCKLYAVYSQDPQWITSKSQPSRVFDGWTVIKYALHGHLGSLYDLEKFVGHNKRKYKATRVNQLRQSIKRGLIPNQFVSEDRVLKAPSISGVLTYGNKRKSLQ